MAESERRQEWHGVAILRTDTVAGAVAENAEKE